MTGKIRITRTAWMGCAASVGAAAVLTTAGAAQPPRTAADLEAYAFAPRTYVAPRLSTAPTIDGRLDDDGWKGAAWTTTFVDIEGERKGAPRLQTRAKMAWDDQSFYIAAELEEPDVWGTLTERDAVIFRDNDFEVFIDPDGDTHAYYELEVNALATPWDLLLIKPYRDGGPAINAWDIARLQVGVDVQGSLNKPDDRDRGWSVELALPWTSLKEAASPHRPPAPGDRWRVNFSRVQWQTDVVQGKTVKRRRPGTSEPLPEDNWVWSPQGVIDMHVPERWGYVQFGATASALDPAPAMVDTNERLKWALRLLYYRQRDYHRTRERYATTLEELEADRVRVPGLTFRPSLRTTDSLYEITAPGDGAVGHIDQDGRVWIAKVAR
jgi:hypothetical protein